MEALRGPEGVPLWAAYEENLRAVRDLLASKRIALLLIAYPSNSDLAPGDDDRPGTRLAAMASRLGVSYLDLLPAMRAAATSGEALYLLPADGHPSPAGHRAAARCVAEFVRTQWFPRPAR